MCDFPDRIEAEMVRGFKQLPRGSTCPREGYIGSRHYVLKCGSFSKFSGDGHVHNECVADALLRAAGCGVPASREYHADIGNGRVETLRLSEFIENGRDLWPAYHAGTAAQRQKLIAQILATYPVVAFIDGTDSFQHHSLDNVLVDADYNLWYIDNGASFDYRARGLSKGWFWSRNDPKDESHGFFAVWKYASDSFKEIVRSVSETDLRKSASQHDFVELAKCLPNDYQRKELLSYAAALNTWARQGSGREVAIETPVMSKGGVMTSEDCEWLEFVSLQIAKMVRRIDKFIDDGKADKTATSRTATNYSKEVDVMRLRQLSPQDVSGRVERLLGVCDDIANSAASGFAVKVLAGRWNRTAPSAQRIGRSGNVDFVDYAFTRAGYVAAGGVISGSESRILAVADVHGNWEDIPVDGHGLVLIAGDIRPGTMYTEDIIKYAGWTKNFFNWMARFPETAFVVVPGNHDFELAVEQLSKLKRTLPENAHILCDEEWIWNGIRIYGTPWTTMKNKGWTKREATDLEKLFDGIPQGLDILVSHTPPYVEENGFVTENCSKELTMAIEDRKPRLVICGHEHSLSHAPFQLGESKVVLVSMKEGKKDAEFTYQPYEFDV